MGLPYMPTLTCPMECLGYGPSLLVAMSMCLRRVPKIGLEMACRSPLCAKSARFTQVTVVASYYSGFRGWMAPAPLHVLDGWGSI